MYQCLVLLLFLPFSVAECPSGSVLWSSTCYFFMSTPQSFTQAESTCNNLSGNLASIHDAFANAFIYNAAQSAFSTNFDSWIGISCNFGNCSWTDGSPFTYNDFKDSSNLNGCGSLSLSDGQWNIGSCSDEKAFVCERSETLTTPTASQSLCPSDEWNYFNETNSCYYWTTPSDWVTTEAFCVSQNAHLTSLHSDAELGFLSFIYNGDVWVGLHADSGSIELSTVWNWTDGSNLDYLPWGSPSLYNNYQCVAANGGIWNIDCSSNMTGICKKPSSKVVPTTVSPPFVKCPDGWGYYGYTNSCYLGPTPNLTQNAAENFCISKGGHMSSIHSYDELTFLLYVTSYQNIWTGLYATDNPIQINTTWKWTDNTPVDYIAWNNSIPTLDNKLCVASTSKRFKYNTTYTFQNCDCSSSYITVCKRPPLNTSPTTTPAYPPKPAGICDNVWTFANYFVPFAMLNWTTAEEYCEYCGGYLTSFHNNKEILKVANNLFSHGVFNVYDNDDPHVWIGLYSDNSRRTWKWKDGSTYDFSRWRPQNPYQDGALCANLELPNTGINGLTNKQNCSTNLYSVCIKP